MLLHDEIESEILGSSVRTGLVYKIMPSLNLGLSYAFPNKYFITEDVVFIYREPPLMIHQQVGDSFEGDFPYESQAPWSIESWLGAYENISCVSLPLDQLELIDYRNTAVTLTLGSGL